MENDLTAAIAPAVSVVLPVYNCPHYVGGAIESVLAQTFPDFELIVIDDGSQDETPTVLRRYTDPRIRLVTQENRGLAATLNRGIELARGRYIARQDQDDIALPERCANVCFGGVKRNRLFMAAAHSLYALYVNTQGAPGG